MKFNLFSVKEQLSKLNSILLLSLFNNVNEGILEILQVSIIDNISTLIL